MSVVYERMAPKKDWNSKWYKMGHGTEGPGKASLKRDAGIRGAAEKPRSGVLAGISRWGGSSLGIEVL